MDSSRNIYGTTFYGGPNNSGTVFELLKGANSVTTIATLGGTSAYAPFGGLIIDAAGNRYGTASSSLSGDSGSVFELPVGSNSITVIGSLASFQGGTQFSNLLMDSAGNMYAVAETAGNYNSGTGFELVKGSNSIVELAVFNGTNGTYPYDA